MRLSYILNALSTVIMYIGLFLLLPVLVALIYKEQASVVPFMSASVLSVGVGFLMRKICPQASSLENLNDIKKSEALFIVAVSWIMFAIIAALPYLFYNLSFVDALFESTSGITTTGATIFKTYDYANALFFWRSLTQWLGGIGIIVMFVAVLPQFAVAGRQMFFAETPGPTEDKFTPRVRSTAILLWSLYLALTVLAVILLTIFGMPLFDSVCNAMSTLAAGGFSPNSSSIMGYHKPLLTWIILIFMFFAGSSMNLQYKVLVKKKNPFLFFKSEEFCLYFWVVIISSAAIAFVLITKDNYGIHSAIRHSLFQVISMMTSTGSASIDFAQWGYPAKILLFITMFFGSCASSAGGGIKMTRWLHPNAVINVKVEDAVVAPEVLRQVIVFVFYYFAIFILGAILITFIEHNHIYGLTSSITALGNIGPGFGAIGPMGSFADFHISSKLIMIFWMLIGRLEIIPFLVMTQRDFWSIKI